MTFYLHQRADLDRWTNDFAGAREFGVAVVCETPLLSGELSEDKRRYLFAWRGPCCHKTRVRLVAWGGVPQLNSA